MEQVALSRVMRWLARLLTGVAMTAVFFTLGGVDALIGTETGVQPATHPTGPSVVHPDTPAGARFVAPAGQWRAEPADIPMLDQWLGEVALDRAAVQITDDTSVDLGRLTGAVIVPFDLAVETNGDAIRRLAAAPVTALPGPRAPPGR